jgi:hypothetical protein
MYRFIGLFALTLAATGCTDQIDQAQSNVDSAADLVCPTCYGAFIFYSSAEACFEGVEDLYGVSDVEAQCLRDVIGREPTAGEYYDCLLTAQNEIIRCYGEHNEPCDNPELVECTTNFGDDERTCNETYLSDSAREAINDCLD